MTINQAFQKYIFTKQAKGLSYQTINDYVFATKAFRQKFGSREISSLCIEDIMVYFINMNRTGKLSQTTCNTYQRNIKLFLRWAHVNASEMGFDPSKLEVIPREKKSVNLLSNDAIKALFDSVESKTEWLTIRNKAIIFIMLDSGLRQGEVAGLRMDNINLDMGTALVTGKGKKQRIVPIKTVVSGLIKAYLYKRPFDSEYVFIGRYGEPITGNAIRKMVERIKRKTGINISSHALRHNFATNYCVDSIKRNGTANIAALSALMGHSDTVTTERYQHIALDHLASETYISHVDNIIMQ